MTLDTIPGNVTRPTDEEREIDRLKAEVEMVREQLRDTVAAMLRSNTVAFQAQNAAIDLAAQVATLTAERDALKVQHAKRHDELTDAWAEIDGLKADLSARMLQLNEARASTVEANMALADMTAERDAALRLRMGELVGVVEKEREACAKLAYGMVDDWACPKCDHDDAAHDLAAEIDHAIRARGQK